MLTKRNEASGNEIALNSSREHKLHSGQRPKNNLTSGFSESCGLNQFRLLGPV